MSHRCYYSQNKTKDTPEDQISWYTLHLDQCRIEAMIARTVSKIPSTVGFDGIRCICLQCRLEAVIERNISRYPLSSDLMVYAAVGHQHTKMEGCAHRKLTPLSQAPARPPTPCPHTRIPAHTKLTYSHSRIPTCARPSKHTANHNISLHLMP